MDKTKKYFLLLVFMWTLTLLICFAWYVHDDFKEIRKSALLQARASFEKDLMVRRWNAKQGGVYVPRNDNTPPNPYLSMIPERDIITPSGRELTLMNPAYMTRKLYEMAEHEKLYYGHITSLKPIRPENRPDSWELKALQAFEAGAEEIYSEEDFKGEKMLRLMKPLLVEAICLKCHAAQGYKIGDIRGGISVSLPMAPYYDRMWRHIKVTAVGMFFIWLLSCGGIALSYRKIRDREEELERYRQGLEELVAERSADLKNLHKQLLNKEKLAAIGKLSGSVAHDIRNPLGAISNSIYYLDLISTEETDAAIRKHITIMEHEIKKANDIIGDLLDFSRDNAPALSLGDINSLIQKSVEQLILPDNVTAQVKLDPALTLFLFDQAQIQRVVDNIFANAVQSMAEGGGVLHVTTHMSHGKCSITIRDSGSGISAEEIEKIFDPLYTTRAKGVGLGLSMVKTFIEKHNGTIDVESKQGEGTTFTVCLPVSDS